MLVLEAEATTGIMRRGPRISKGSFWRPVKRRSGDSSGWHGVLKTGGDCWGAFSMTSELQQELMC